MATAAEVIKKAKSYVGVHESPPNSNKVIFNTWYYGRVVSGSAYPWCAAFTSYVFAHCGMTKSEYAHGVYTPSQANWYKTRGRWHTGTPKPGDVAFYDFGLGRISHTEIVVKGYGRKNHLSVGGNTGGTNPRDGGMVALVRRSGGSIVGYGRPYYSGASGAPSAPNKEGIAGMSHNAYGLVPMSVAAGSEKTLTFDKGKTNGYALVAGGEFSATVELQIAPGFTGHGQIQFFELDPSTFPGTIKSGSTGANVERVQRAIGLTGGDVDGDFGPQTLSALKRYEKAHGMAVDGVVGKTQWSKMFPARVTHRYRPQEFVGSPGNTFVVATRSGAAGSGKHLRVSISANEAMSITSGRVDVLH